eukprot:scaffold277958_cov20-Prasinocladus_malaysianus.AAC.1
MRPAKLRKLPVPVAPPVRPFAAFAGDSYDNYRFEHQYAVRYSLVHDRLIARFERGARQSEVHPH